MNGHMREFPVRPTCPPVFVAACVLWLAVLAAFQVALQCGMVRNAVPDALRAGTYEVELAEDMRATPYGTSCKARVHAADGRAYNVLLLGDASCKGRVRERFSCALEFKAFSNESFERYAREGLVARAVVSRMQPLPAQGPFSWVVGLRNAAISRLGQVEELGGALLAALLVGDRTRLEERGLYDAMKAAGLAHMVAVSGAHLAVAGGVVALCLRMLRVPRKAVACSMCVVYTLYALFTGLTAPVIRAALMASVVVLSVWGSRRSSALAALSVCVCLLLALHPQNAFSLSFFLSAASTAGIVVFAPLLQAYMQEICAGRARALGDACALTTAANLPIFPITACVFARIPLMAPLANFIAAPAFSCLLVAGLACLALGVVAPGAASVLLAALGGVAAACCQVVIACAALPGTSVPMTGNVWALGIACALALACLWRVWPRASKRVLRGVVAGAVALACACSFVLPRIAPDELVMLDVGQGDAVLLKSRGAALLIDTGAYDSAVLGGLARHGVMQLDGVAITHHDTDHCGALPALAGAVRGGIYVARPALSCACAGCAQLRDQAGRVSPVGAQGLGVGDTLRIGRFTCTVVWPAVFEDEGGNADSLCMAVEHDANADGVADARVLLVGDAEAAQVSAMLEDAKLNESRIDVFKAGHHGSRAGMTEALAQRLDANVVLISVGAHNRYGHPNVETLHAFETSGSRIFRTDEQGDVTCRFSKRGISVFAQKNAGLVD